jgi:DNA-binding NarL/FixJ family response regulator
MDNAATPVEEIRVVLVEDDRRLREALRALLDGTPGTRCLAAFGSAEETLAWRAPEAPQVFLLDIALPGRSGSEAVPELLARWPGSAAVMLTVFEEEDRIFEALCNGAVGYILKRAPRLRLLEAIREVREGGSPMSPEIARKAIRELQRQGRSRLPLPPDTASLTPQDVRLLRLLAEGHGYQDAASEMGVSINTVRNHIRRIYEKLSVHSRAEAVAKGLRAELV